MWRTEIIRDKDVIRKRFAERYRNQWLNEVMTYQLLAEHCPNLTPELLDIDDGSNPSFDIEWIQGVHFSSLSIQAREIAVEKLGRMVASVHSIHEETGCYRWVRDDPSKGVTPTEYWRRVIKKIEHDLVAGGISETQVHDLERMLLETWFELQGGTSASTLIHRDLRFDNIIFVGGLPMIIDWEQSSFGFADLDLSRLLSEELDSEGDAANAFLGGYREIFSSFDHKRSMRFCRIIYCLEMLAFFSSLKEQSMDQARYKQKLLMELAGTISEFEGGCLI